MKKQFQCTNCLKLIEVNEKIFEQTYEGHEACLTCRSRKGVKSNG